MKQEEGKGLLSSFSLKTPLNEIILFLEVLF